MSSHRHDNVTDNYCSSTADCLSLTTKSAKCGLVRLRTSCVSGPNSCNLFGNLARVAGSLKYSWATLNIRSLKFKMLKFQQNYYHNGPAEVK